MVSWGPVTPTDFKKKINALIESYMQGHDEKTRLVVKTKYTDESEERHNRWKKENSQKIST